MVKFDVRGGPRLRKKVYKVNALKTKRHVCPRCGKEQVKRKSVARWECRTCGAVFAGGAYSPTTPTGVTGKRLVEDLKAGKKIEVAKVIAEKVEKTEEEEEKKEGE